MREYEVIDFSEQFYDKCEGLRMITEDEGLWREGVEELVMLAYRALWQEAYK